MDWNPKFENFFTHYGFVPRLCRPYRPQTKGKIERTVGFVKRDFFMGGKFSSFSDLNSQLQGWLSRDAYISYLGNLYSVPYRFAEGLPFSGYPTLPSPSSSGQRESALTKSSQVEVECRETKITSKDSYSRS